MNVILGKNNKIYDNFYNDMDLLNKTNLFKLKEIFLNYCEIINEIGKIFF